MYSTYGKEAWNDELLVGAQESEPSGQIKALLRDADLEVEEQIDEEEGSARETVRRIVEVERPEERETEADRKGDVESLNRALQRTLYLVVKGKDGRWVFPAGTPEGRESLHRVSDILLSESWRSAIANGYAGCGEDTCAVWWHQHEYLGRWKRASRPLG